MAGGDPATVGLAAGAAGAAAGVIAAGLFLGIDELVVEVGVWAPAALAVSWYRTSVGRGAGAWPQLVGASVDTVELPVVAAEPPPPKVVAAAPPAIPPGPTEVPPTAAAPSPP